VRSLELSVKETGSSDECMRTPSAPSGQRWGSTKNPNYMVGPRKHLAFAERVAKYAHSKLLIHCLIHEDTACYVAVPFPRST
jgi:hypothetical protein